MAKYQHSKRFKKSAIFTLLELIVYERIGNFPVKSIVTKQLLLKLVRNHPW